MSISIYLYLCIHIYLNISVSVNLYLCLVFVIAPDDWRTNKIDLKGSKNVKCFQYAVCFSSHIHGKLLNASTCNFIELPCCDVCYETLSSDRHLPTFPLNVFLALSTFRARFVHKSTSCNLTRRKTGKGNVIVVVVHTMTAYGKVEVQLHRFFKSALHAGDWSASHLAFFTVRD